MHFHEYIFRKAIARSVFRALRPGPFLYPPDLVGCVFQGRLQPLVRLPITLDL